MGIAFRLSRQDHNKVEDFLASRPSHVDGIWVEAGNLVRQATVIEQARALGLAVLVEPMTDRLADEGFESKTIPYATGSVIDVERLGRSVAHRQRLVDSVLNLQVGATLSTPPHFYVHDDTSAALNLALVGATIEIAVLEVRAILLAKRAYLADKGVAADLARRYADIGVTEIDLRLSPLGTSNEGARKIHSAFEVIQAFNHEGIRVHFGSQGLIGQTALALGVVDGFSVGLGSRESVDHGGAISTQKRPKDESAKNFGLQPGVWIPEAEITVPRRLGNVILNDGRVRSRLACSIGGCANDILGPLNDPRAHYLHSRASEVSTLLSRPAAWRSSHEEGRLRRAIEMRGILNDVLPTVVDDRPVPRFRVRTLESLIGEIDGRREALSA